jgi:NADH-ubiquinone oxidoreductase chain 6
MAVIVSVLFLISLFLVIAVNLIFIGVHFIALAYFLVYIGAISILFLFTIMLMNIRAADLVSYTSNSLPLAFIFALIIFNVINYSFPYESSASIDIDLTSSIR